jgi:hypothetical protein
MISQAPVKDMNMIRKLGIEVLTERLGPIGMIEFIHQFDSGYGDYTKERHEWLDNLSIEDISDAIKRSSKAEHSAF